MRSGERFSRSFYRSLGDVLNRLDEIERELDEIRKRVGVPLERI